MNRKYELTILKKMVEQAMQKGFLDEAGINVADVSYILDTSSVLIRRDGPHESIDHDVTLHLFAPLTNRHLAMTFFGSEMQGDPLFGRMPAWIYQQYKLLDILQKEDEQGMFLYLATFL